MSLGEDVMKYCLVGATTATVVATSIGGIAIDVCDVETVFVLDEGTVVNLVDAPSEGNIHDVKALAL